MPIAALVVTLDPDPQQRQQALLALGSDARFTLGAPHGLRLPVVIEGNDEHDTLAAMESAQRATGVVLVEVVSVDFSDVENTDTYPTRRRHMRTEH